MVYTYHPTRYEGKRLMKRPARLKRTARKSIKAEKADGQTRKALPCVQPLGKVNTKQKASCPVDGQEALFCYSPFFRLTVLSGAQPLSG